MRNRGETHWTETGENEEEGKWGGAGECTGGEGVVKRAPTGSSHQIHTVTLPITTYGRSHSVAGTVSSDHPVASPKQPIIAPI